MSVKTPHLTLALAAALSLAACSGQKDQSAPAATADKASVSDALSPAAIQKAAEAAKAATLPQPDANTPDASYVKITSGNQLMFLYAAYSGLPPDFASMANAYSREYRGTNDSFRKHDLLVAIQPKLEAEIANAKAHPYVIWDTDSPNLNHYDFDRKGFVSDSGYLDEGGYGYFYDNSDYKLGFSNGSDFKFLSVTDDTLARRVESLVGKYNSMSLRIFGFVQTTDGSNTNLVKALITKVQVLDNKGNLLFEKKAGDK